MVCVCVCVCCGGRGYLMPNLCQFVNNLIQVDFVNLGNLSSNGVD